MPKLPVATAFWTPGPSLETGAKAWILADAMGIESVVIDENTEIGGLKNQLRWNSIYYK